MPLFWGTDNFATDMLKTVSAIWPIVYTKNQHKTPHKKSLEKVASHKLVQFEWFNKKNIL